MLIPPFVGLYERLPADRDQQNIRRRRDKASRPNLTIRARKIASHWLKEPEEKPETKESAE